MKGDEEEIYPEIALYQPQIPQNTGNIGRMVLGFNTKLHLIGPLGFQLSDKHLKRAGLDYWKNVDVSFYDNFEIFYEASKERKRALYAFTKSGEKSLKDADIKKNSLLLFGREQNGIDARLLKKYNISTVHIKMMGPIRSHNLSNAAAMVLYDVFRRNDLI